MAKDYSKNKRKAEIPENKKVLVDMDGNKILSNENQNSINFNQSSMNVVNIHNFNLINSNITNNQGYNNT